MKMNKLISRQTEKAEVEEYRDSLQKKITKDKKMQVEKSLLISEEGFCHKISYLEIFDHSLEDLS